MANTNKHTKAIGILSAIIGLLLFVGFITNAWDLMNNEGGIINAIQPIVLAIATVWGAFYVLAGCKKGEGSTYMKWFINMYALAVMFALLGHEIMSAVDAIFTTVSFGILTVMSCAKDLGKKKSTGLAALNLIVTAVLTVLFFFEKQSTDMLLRVIVQLLLAVTTVFIIFAKYEDKATRGSK